AAWRIGINSSRLPLNLANTSFNPASFVLHINFHPFLECVSKKFFEIRAQKTFLQLHVSTT
ncbi:MAG: hypothetical protein KGZ96_14730, partial [Clostridia bacterium]|nr:hypothetical protein [Clostridia bacterium]